MSFKVLDNSIDIKKVARLVHEGEIVVMSTDTVYGVVASALRSDAVERVYSLRERNMHKPCIVLIASIEAIKLFGVVVDVESEKKIHEIWLAAVSIVLSCPDERFSYLHRGTQTIAFRVPEEKALRDFLEESGPVIAPSANPEGKSTAKTTAEARDYFGGKISLYIDGGMQDGEPSTLISINRGEISVLRQGRVKV